jgi:hypothetical protein
MQGYAHPCTHHDGAREILGNEVVEGFVDARDVDDDSGNLRHGTYESTHSVARGRCGTQAMCRSDGDARESDPDPRQEN